jgi:hypothetical protein
VQFEFEFALCVMMDPCHAEPSCDVRFSQSTIISNVDANPSFRDADAKHEWRRLLCPSFQLFVHNLYMISFSRPISSFSSILHLHPPPQQKLLNLLLMMPLDNHMSRDTVYRNILLCLHQHFPQLIPQRTRIASNLAHSSQVQVAAALEVCVDGQVLAGGARDVVFGRRQLVGWRWGL